jgi:hypothetical protein
MRIYREDGASKKNEKSTAVNEKIKRKLHKRRLLVSTGTQKAKFRLR